MRYPLAAALLLVLAPFAHAGDGPTLRLIDTVDVPGWSEEIVSYCASEKLLVVTNPHWKTLDMFTVESFDPAVLHAIDFNDDLPDAQGQSTLYEPTSVAVHPALPIALVSVKGRGWNEAGRVIGLDLRAGSRGVQLFSITIGIQPDSIAVSRDGRWAVMACEAEADDDSPGSIWAIDLAALSLDDTAADQAIPAMQIGDLGALLFEPVGTIEPEFVAIDPESRFAVVSCQENDALVFVDLRSDTPTLAGFHKLGPSSEPDGCAILDNVPHPDEPSRLGCLVAVAEEGTLDKFGDRMGQNLTLLWVDPDRPGDKPVTCSLTHIPTALGDDDHNKRRDPENTFLLRKADRTLALVSCERGDWLLAFDVTDSKHPVLGDHIKVGDRPEGLLALDDADQTIVVTGDEGAGNQGPGTLSFTRLTMPKTTQAAR